jgi:uncharacterized lipoprotein YmbA
MKALLGGLSILLLMAACVSRQPDHFYVLEAQPSAGGQSQGFRRQVTLRMTVPALVDRNELVLFTKDGVAVMDHERWAAPLADLMTTTLSQDIERRRGDVVVLLRSADQAKLPLVKITVDVDQVTAHLGEQVSIEAHWRVSDARSGGISVGRDVFVAPLQSASYQAMAAGLSSCVAMLAERLAKEIPAD